MTTDSKLLAQQPGKIFLLSLGAGIAVIALTFAAWGATRPSNDTELAQWFPAVAGAMTLIAAVVAAIFAAGAFSLEYRREIRLLDDAERAQAESFVAWTGSATVASSEGNSTVTYGVIEPRLNLRNASNLPIFDVTLEFRISSDHSGLDRKPLPPMTVRLVPPNETMTLTIQGRDFVVPKPVGFNGNTPIPHIDFEVAIQFRDTGNRYWRRHSDGTIEKNAGQLRFL